MTKRLVVGSGWKMTKTRVEAHAFVRDLRQRLGSYDALRVQVYVQPSFTALDVVGQALAGCSIHLAAQDMFWEDSGSYTGEVSPLMLCELGCTFVMVGHSERRLVFGETDEMVNRKVMAALRHRITPLVCVGETREERHDGLIATVLRRQLSVALQGVSVTEMASVIVLYEPRWAIGQGEAAPLSCIQDTHGLIRSILADLYGVDTAVQTRVIYGGSVNLSNMSAILAQSEVDGCGVGRAAWDPVAFAEMVRLTEAEARRRAGII